MVFLYSRKLQLIMLLCWLAGMFFLYTRISGIYTDWSVEENELLRSARQEARLGATPSLPAAPEPVEAAPPVIPAPAPDPELNRCLDLRLVHADPESSTLVFELDYIPAAANGFTLEKAHSYHIDDNPAFVVALGEPWVSDAGSSSFSTSLPQAPNVQLIVSKSKHLRLLFRTNSLQTARKASFSAYPTDRGIRLEIRLPKG